MVADRLTRASKQLTIHAEPLASKPHARNNKSLLSSPTMHKTSFLPRPTTTVRALRVASDV